MKRFIAGLLLGLALTGATFLGARYIQAQRAPHATAQLLNESTQARRIHPIRPGREKDEKFFPMHVERH